MLILFMKGQILKTPSSKVVVFINNFLVDAFVNVEEDQLDYIRANQNHKFIKAYMKQYLGEMLRMQWLSARLTTLRQEGKPDIVARVFQEKVIDMIAYIKLGKPFDRTIASAYRFFILIIIHLISFSYFFKFLRSKKDVCAVEFQKRGLPHTCLLIWLDAEFKCRSAEDVDSIVSAKNPSKNADSIFYDIISKFMIHGPYGLPN
uniref:Uncharacterized protein n=1 Tax=Salix viminalis TaxID=40686 RepID=A0A6N2KR16_SALVM